MRLTTDLHEFFATTGIISEPELVCELGLATDDICATFYQDDVPRLLAFCTKYPQFHIVSAVHRATVYVNCYREDGDAFKLASGDQDPDYALDARAVIQEALVWVGERLGSRVG